MKGVVRSGFALKALWKSLNLLVKLNFSSKTPRESPRLVACVQRKWSYFANILGDVTSLWCNSFNLPESEVGSGSQRVMNTFLIRALV
jgi:hypothetical protein